MKNLIEEINNNLSNKNYLSALALTLILPDICAKIEYPELIGGKYNRQRYERWYNEFIYPYELCPIENNPYKEWVMDGFAVYKLRCNLLHDGSTDINQEVIEKKKIKSYQSYKFILTNNFNSYSLLWADGDKEKAPSITVKIGIEDFCKKICAVVENHYLKKYPDLNLNNEVVIFDFID